MCLRHCLPVLLLLIFTGCNIQNLKPAPDLANFAESQKKADAAYRNEDWKTAEKEYLYLAQNFPNEVEPWFRLGNIYARTGKLDAAVGAYREALVKDTKNGKVWHNLGIVQLRQATNTFQEMLAYTDPNDPLNQRAKKIIDTISDLMANRLGTEVPE